VAEYQITSWREIPSLVTARDGDVVAKVSMPARFQEAIDEAAMRLGDTGSEAYLAGWLRGPWTTGDGDPTALAARVAADQDEQWSAPAVATFLDGLSAPSGDR